MHKDMTIIKANRGHNKRGASRGAPVVVGVLFVSVALVTIVFASGLFFYFAAQYMPTPTDATDVTEPTETTVETKPTETAAETTTETTVETQPSETKTIDDGKALDVVEIVNRVAPATVSVVIDLGFVDHIGQRIDGFAAGSGFIVSEDGYIITNQHVIDGAEAVFIVLPSEPDAIEATVIGEDTLTDIAVLKIDRDNLPYVMLGDSDKLQVGELAVAIGNPFGELAGTVTTGVISAVDRQLADGYWRDALVQTDASINSGNSGGPLVNRFGEVIAVTTAKIQGAEGIGFAIPINTVKAVMDEMIEHGYVSGRPWIGIAGFTVDEQSAEQYGWPEGAYVRSVDEGGPADEAGILVGDIIVAIDGEAVQDVYAVNEIKNRYQPGDEVTVTVYRNGRTRDLVLVLGEDQPR